MGIHDLDTVIHEVPKPPKAPGEPENLAQSTISEGGKNEGNVIGGYKATLKSAHLVLAI